jgi:nucleotide sugar dehydrogenase
MTDRDPNTVCVVGLGKIGLPLAVQYAGRGFRVHGLDINEATVDLVNAGVEPFPGEYDLGRRLGEAVASGQLTATTDAEDAVGSSAVVVVVVPIVVHADGSADFRAMDQAVEAIGRAVRPGTLVLFETTVPVGTTRTRFAPTLAELSGLTIGEDLLVAYSPERVLTGRTFADLRRYPKLVGGLEQASADRARECYEAALEFDERPDLARPNGVWDLGSAEAAELAKLAETTFRDVNIALANTFAVYAESTGIDVHAVIEACNSQPFSHIHSPGVAVGGHCIPVYPQLYLTTDPQADLVRVARQVNAGMPARTVDRLEGLLGSLEGRRIAVLGAAYRGGVKETAFSGVFPLVSELASRGAAPLVHDPLFSDEELATLGLVPYHRGDAADAAIVQADHAEYRQWEPQDIPGVTCLVDGRAFTSEADWPGVVHVVIGR